MKGRYGVPMRLHRKQRRYKTPIQPRPFSYLVIEYKKAMKSRDFSKTFNLMDTINKEELDNTEKLQLESIYKKTNKFRTEP